MGRAAVFFAHRYIPLPLYIPKVDSENSTVCTSPTKQSAVDLLITLFGQRLPNREDWVTEKNTPAAIRKKPVVAATAITPSAARSHVSG